MNYKWVHFLNRKWSGKCWRQYSALFNVIFLQKIIAKDRGQRRLPNSALFNVRFLQNLLAKDTKPGFDRISIEITTPSEDKL